MKHKPKKIRKSITVKQQDLIKSANRVFGNPYKSKLTKKMLKSRNSKKANAELWKATREFIESMRKYKIKTLFS